KFGRIEARVVGVKETVDGNPIEVSRNFYACCTQKHTIFYFGEEVDIYKKGKAITGFDPYSALRFQRHVLGSRAASRRRGD
ncbi:MAG: hypothetical protein KJ645_01980, partial [Planctomycetes bacterium]|nr:hypothetical protein [Planctomycetota bacterium]